MKIICIGRNYPDHAKEMSAPIPSEPVFFLKPDSSLLRNNKPFFYPNFSNNLQYEVEVVVKICRLGRSIAKRFAYRYYEEIGLGIDFTARDLQQKCKEKGLPWEVAKAFDGAAPISKFYPKANLPLQQGIEFWLEQNGKEVQRGNTSEMLFDIDTLIAYVSQFITLRTGDLLYTGTPSGVGGVAIGDRLKGYLNGEPLLDFFIK